VMYCDAGTDPDPTLGTTILDNPFSPADGILDQLTTDCQFSVEWVAIASVAGPYDYDIIVEPGPVLESECPFYSATWLGELKWTAKDGVPNNAAIASPAPFFTPGYMTCPNIYTILDLTGFSVFRVHGITDGAFVVLPVELLHFSGKVETAGNRLFWSTESENNNDYFILESSADAIDFSPIGIIDGAGTTTIEQQYGFLDTNPIAATSYYRLKTVDFDGKQEETETIVLSRPTQQSLSVHPVPAMSDVHIVLNSDFAGSAQLYVYAMDGTPVLSRTWEITHGNNVLPLDIHTWMPGTYIVEVNGMGTPQRAKLIKQ